MNIVFVCMYLNRISNRNMLQKQSLHYLTHDKAFREHVIHVWILKIRPEF